MNDAIGRLKVDAVIPTFNCASDLELCLQALSVQTERADLNLIIVDGGSTDSTIDVAKKYGASVYVNPGQYGTGLTGGRHFGETIGEGDVLWYVDSDNIILGRHMMGDLLRPFVEDPENNISVPVPQVHPSFGGFSNWITLVDQDLIASMKSTGTRTSSGYTVVPEMEYGLLNCVMLRRTAMERVGGFDSDARVLLRLRRLKLARGAVVESARFIHHQSGSPRTFAVKWAKRIEKYGNMTDPELRSYFVEYPSPPADRARVRSYANSSIVRFPLQSVIRFLESRDRTWLWGLSYPLTIAAVGLVHPRLLWKTNQRFF